VLISLQNTPIANAGPAMSSAVAAVTVPVTVAVSLVVVTGIAVWVAMNWRRLSESRRRTAVRCQALEEQHVQLVDEIGAVRSDRESHDQAVAKQERQADRLKRRNRTLEKILAVSARINATRNTSELLDKVVSAVEEIIGFRKVVLHLWSDGTKAFEARAFAGIHARNVVALTAIQVSRVEYDELSHVRHRYSNCYLVRAGEADECETCQEQDSEGQPLLSRRWAEELLLIAPLISPSGEVVGYLSLDDPISGEVPGMVEIRQLEFLVQQATTAIESAEVYDNLARNNAELSLASEKLASLNDMKANFVANVSHELRTPLTSISAYTELLQQNMDTMSEDARSEFLKVINQESLRLTAIINDILELGRMENGRAALSPEDSDLVALVRRLDESWRSRAHDQNIRFTVDAGTEDIRLPVDNVLFQQLLGHLVGNAFKFTPEGGQVTVRVEETGTAVKLTVQDTGIGIPEDKLGEIFDQFYQVDGSSTREHDGQGVGLAICHDIVSHHDGRIWAENLEPAGARFTVLLPHRPAVLQPTDVPVASGFPFGPGEFMQRLMHWISESLGIQVATLMVPDEDREFLTIRAAIGLPESVVQSARIRKGAGVAGKVWATGRTLLLEDVTGDERFGRELNEPRYTTPSLLCVPLQVEGRSVGVISVNNRIDGSPLDDDDRLFLESLAPRLTELLSNFQNWQDGLRDFHAIKDTLRSTTAVGNLRQESLLEVCQEVCLATARRIMLPPEELEYLAFSLQFYDVGLSRVPPHLLNKPGPLVGAEERVVQQHVRASLEILEPLRPAARVRQLILHHHENFDGSGYPHKLAGEAIPLGSRLVRLADTLAALLSRRPWRPAFTLDQALAEIRAGSGKAFCPRMTDVFLAEAEQRRERIRRLQAGGGDNRELHRPVLDRRGLISLKT